MLRHGLLAAALVLLLAGAVLVPAAQAGGPTSIPNRGFAYPYYNPNPTYYYYPYTYSYNYAPYVYQYAAPTYVSPPTYAFPNRGYAYPSASYGGWGSFGTYDNWARAFYSNHGRWPNSQDVSDYWWSQDYAARTGVSPYQSWSYPYGSSCYGQSC